MRTLRPFLAAMALGLAAPAVAQPPDPLEEAITPRLAERLAEREEDWLREIRERSPERHQELLALRDESPFAYALVLQRLARHAGLEERGPPARRGGPHRSRLPALERELIERASAPVPRGGEQARRGELRELAEALFDARQAERRQRLERMAQRVEQLQAELSDREARRAELVDAMVERALAGP